MLGAFVNLTILAVGIFALRVAEQYVGLKMLAGGIILLAGILAGWLMERSGREQEVRDRDLEAKGRQELALTGRGLGP